MRRAGNANRHVARGECEPARGRRAGNANRRGADEPTRSRTGTDPTRARPGSEPAQIRTGTELRRAEPLRGAAGRGWRKRSGATIARWARRATALPRLLPLTGSHLRSPVPLAVTGSTSGHWSHIRSLVPLLWSHLHSTGGTLVPKPQTLNPKPEPQLVQPLLVPRPSEPAEQQPLSIIPRWIRIACGARRPRHPVSYPVSYPESHPESYPASYPHRSISSKYPASYPHRPH